MKEPRKVLYEDTDLLSTVNYTRKENNVDKESGNVRDATDMLERTRDGLFILTGVCIRFFLKCFLNLTLFTVHLLNTNIRNQI